MCDSNDKEGKSQLHMKIFFLIMTENNINECLFKSFPMII